MPSRPADCCRSQPGGFLYDRENPLVARLGKPQASAACDGHVPPDPTVAALCETSHWDVSAVSWGFPFMSVGVPTRCQRGPGWIRKVGGPRLVSEQDTHRPGRAVRLRLLSASAGPSGPERALSRHGVRDHPIIAVPTSTGVSGLAVAPAAHRFSTRPGGTALERGSESGRCPLPAAWGPDQHPIFVLH